MAQKHDIPEVNAEALSDFAKNFPHATAKVDEAIVPPSVSIAAPALRRKGAGFATFLAFMALLLAALSLAMPTGRPWVKVHYGEVIRAKVGDQMFDLLLGPANEQEAHADAFDNLQGRAAAAIDRLSASDAGNAALAARLAGLETSVTVLGGRVDALGTGSAMGSAPTKIEAVDGPNPATTLALSRVEAQEKELGAAIGRVGKIESEMDTVSKRLDVVDQAGRSFGTVAQRVDAAEAALTAATGRIATLEGGINGGGARLDKMDSAITAVGARIGTIETALSSTDGRFGGLDGKLSDSLKQARLAQLALLILQLNNTAQTHKPFPRELAAVRALADTGNQAIATQLNVMAAHADVGVATTAELRDSFSAILVPKLKSVAGGGERSWSDRLRAWLSNVIAPAGSGPADGDPTLKIIAATTQKLAEDDLRGAMETLSQLEGPAATIAARWLIEARARNMLDASCDALGDAVLDLVVAKKG